jgi:microcompartment protein CcmK/EutM
VNFARVVGRVVATRRAPNLTESLLLLLQPLGEDLQERGLPLVAVSPVSAAGRGELVYYVSGSDATGALDDTFQPVDAAVVGFVDGYAGASLPAPRSLAGYESDD